MKEYTVNQILKLEEIYDNLMDFNKGYSEESYNFYKGKAEAVKEIIALIRKTEKWLILK